jgi:hypothetical protein
MSDEPDVGGAVGAPDVIVLLVPGGSYDRATELKAELNRRMVAEKLPFFAEFRDPWGGDPTLAIRAESAPFGADQFAPSTLPVEENAPIDAAIELALVRVRRFAHGFARSFDRDPSDPAWCNPP